jgi:hypothetical protein
MQQPEGMGTEQVVFIGLRKANPAEPSQSCEGISDRRKFMRTYSKYMLTPGVQWVETGSIMEPDGIYFRPMSDRQSSLELAMEHVEDGFLGRPAAALMGYDQEGDRWETLVVCHSAHGLKRRVWMMFGLDIEWDGDGPLEFNRELKELR